MSKGKELSGVLFKNDKRTTDKHPLYRGSCLIAGVEFKIAAWVNEGTNGKYMSLKFEPKDQPETRQQPNAGKSQPTEQDDDGEIPF